MLLPLQVHREEDAKDLQGVDFYLQNSFMLVIWWPLHLGGEATRDWVSIYNHHCYILV